MKKTADKLVRITMTMLVLGFMFQLSACALTTVSQYPSLSGRDSQADMTSPGLHQTAEAKGPLHGQTDAPAARPDNLAVTLRIAGPWTTGQLELIGRYFELLQNQVTTLEGESLQGNQVSLDWLSAYPGDLNLIAIPISLEQGITPEQAATWTATDSWPDLIVTQGLLDPQLAPPLMDLQAIASASPDFRANILMPRLFQQVQQHGPLTYLPWRFSRPVLFENQTLRQELNLPDLPEPVDWSAFVNHMQAAAAVQTGPEKYPILAEASQLLQYWPAARHSDAGWSTWRDGALHLNDPELAEAIGVLQQLEQQGISIRQPAVSTQENPASTGGESPAALYWFGQSSDLKTLRQVPDHPVNFRTLPLPGLSRLSAQPVNLWSLAIPESGPNQEVAARLAAFLAADPDAIKLQLRLEDLPGYFPVVSDSGVWQQVAERYPEGQNLVDWPNQLTAAYIPGTYERTDWTALHETYFVSSWNKLLSSRQPQQLLNQLQKTYEVQDG